MHLRLYPHTLTPSHPHTLPPSQLEELEALKRQLRDKDRELAMQTERVGRGESQTERLEEDLRRMKHAESWSRRSSSATPPRTLSPSNSTDELVVVSRGCHSNIALRCLSSIAS